VRIGSASCARMSGWKRPTWWACPYSFDVGLTTQDPHCVLCPKDLTALINKIKSKKAPSDFDILSAMKPTEGLRWAHILCSTWMPDVLFADAAKLKMVEGIMSLPEERWATVRVWTMIPPDVTHARPAPCATRLEERPFPVPSAQFPSIPLVRGSWGTDSALNLTWSACPFLARFGADVQAQARPGKPLPAVVKFKDEAGVMNPRCFCKTHNLEGRTIYDMHEIDPEQNESALQIYATTYRSLRPPDQPRDQHHDEAFALLRKATRLDRQIPVAEVVVPAKVCSQCAVDVSPRWHSVQAKDEMDIDDAETGATGPQGKKLVCHQCWFAL